jgi:hypothetical protein
MIQTKIKQAKNCAKSATMAHPKGPYGAVWNLMEPST